MRVEDLASNREDRRITEARSARPPTLHRQTIVATSPEAVAKVVARIGENCEPSMTTVLFLGGWKGPFLDGFWWTLIKIFALAFVVIWLRVSYPRLREDQLQKLAWAWLVPLALVQLALTGVVKVLIAT